MMTKEELIELFQTHKKDFSRLKLRNREKIKLEKKINQEYRESKMETGITNDYSINGDIRSKNSVSDKVGKIPVKQENKKEEFEKQKEKDREKLKELEETIEELEDRVEAVVIRLDVLTLKERKIIEAFYFDGRTCEDIGNNLFWQFFKQTRTEGAITKIIERAINKMIWL